MFGVRSAGDVDARYGNKDFQTYRTSDSPSGRERDKGGRGTMMEIHRGKRGGNRI